MSKKLQIYATTSVENAGSALQAENSIIEVLEDLDMCGKKVFLKASSTVVFNGGMLKNVTYSGYMNFKTKQHQIFDSSVSFENGTILNVPYIRPEWFGAQGKYKKTGKDKGRDYDNDPKEARRIPHDDSAAINQAISVAEQLSIKIVKFSAANYYIGSGIRINKGNIWLQGSGALLREYQRGTKDTTWGIDYTNTRTTTSTLYCEEGKSLLTCADSVSDPIYISDLQFFNDMENVVVRISALKSIAIDFKASYWGPTWPVIIERCYFAWFAKAFRINTADLNKDTTEEETNEKEEIKRAYPLHLLQIRNCAFHYNNYCVYSEKANWESYTGRQHPWSFEFINNCCQENNKIIETAVFKGMCRIEKTNCDGSNPNEEGKLEEDPYDYRKEYAIDIDINQRATAIIKHNRFGANRSFLIRVNGLSAAVGSKAIVERNNTDGVPVNYNKCYFRYVDLETDMPYVETNNCVIERAIPFISNYCLSEGEKVAEGQGDEERAVSVLLKHKGCNSFNIGNGSMYVINTSSAAVPNVFVDTPEGRRCMSYYYNTNYGDVSTLLFSKTVKYSPSKPYLNIEFPYYKKGKNPVACYIPIVITYFDSAGKLIGNSFYISSGHTYKSEGGYYRLRLECKLTSNENVNHVDIQVYVATGNNSLYPEDRLYIGSRTLVLSDKKLDLNDDFGTDPNMQITGGANESCIIRKGDTFVSGCYEIRCLEDGCVLPNKTFVGYNEGKKTITCTATGNNTAMVPIGSIWNCDGYIFKILGVVLDYKASSTDTAFSIDRLSDYKNVTYYIELLDKKVNRAFVGGNSVCVPPVLIGHGRGTTKERNSSTITGKLCSGSTYYDTTLGKMFHLNEALQWVE